LPAGADKAVEIHAGMGVETVIFGRDKGMNQWLRNLIQSDRRSFLYAELSHQPFVAGVNSQRRLILDMIQRFDIRQDGLQAAVDIVAGTQHADADDNQKKEEPFENLFIQWLSRREDRRSRSQAEHAYTKEAAGYKPCNAYKPKRPASSKMRTRDFSWS